jgi:ribosomal-protein-alanine N-acetyltransferase
MSEDDLAEVIAIEREAYPFPWTEQIFRDCLRVGYSCWVLAGRDGVAGYGVMSVAVGESHVLNLCVRPDLQRRGLGRFMLTHLLHLARKHHADTALLEVRPSNHSALNLYQAMGFNEVGVRRGYYPGDNGREDALILARSLTP